MPLFVTGRFDEAVIEERRKAAEAMFQFTTNIPALYNSPHLKEFLRVSKKKKKNTYMLTVEILASKYDTFRSPCVGFLSFTLSRC